MCVFLLFYQLTQPGPCPPAHWKFYHLAPQGSEPCSRSHSQHTQPCAWSELSNPSKWWNKSFFFWCYTFHSLSMRFSFAFLFCILSFAESRKERRLPLRAPHRMDVRLSRLPAGSPRIWQTANDCFDRPCSKPPVGPAPTAPRLVVKLNDRMKHFSLYPAL